MQYFFLLGPLLSSQDDDYHVSELITVAVTTFHVNGPLASSFRKFLKHLQKRSFDWKPGSHSYRWLQHHYKSKLFLDNCYPFRTYAGLLRMVNFFIYYSKDCMTEAQIRCLGIPCIVPPQCIWAKNKECRFPYSTFWSVFLNTCTAPDYKLFRRPFRICLQITESTAEEAIHDHCRWVTHINIY